MYTRGFILPIKLTWPTVYQKSFPERDSETFASRPAQLWKTARAEIYHIKNFNRLILHFVASSIATV